MGASTEVIILEYKASVEGLKAELKTVQTEMKNTEKVGTDSADKTTAAFAKTETAAKSLKSQIRTLKEQLANATDPKDVEKLAQKLGHLQDKLQDAGEAAKIFASTSKFEQMQTALGGVGGKLLAIDFKGVSEQAKLLGTVIKSFSIKDVIEGVKDMGKAFFDIGKALVANPIFLLGAALAGIAYAAYSIGKSFYEINIQTLTVTESLSIGRKALQEYTDKFAESQIRIKLALGQITKDQSDNLNEQLKNQKEFRAKNSEHSEAVLKLAKELNIDIRSLNDKGYSELLRGNGNYQIKLSNEQIRYNIERKKLEDDFNKQTNAIAKTQAETKLAMLIESTQRIKKETLDKNKNTQAILDKLKDDADKKANDDAEKEASDNIKRAKEETLRITKIFLDNQKYRDEQQKEQQKENAKNEADDAKAQLKKENDEKAELQKLYTDEVTKIKKEGEDKITADKKKAAADRKAIDEASLEFIGQAFDTMNQIQQNNIRGEIDGINEKHDADVSALDDQLKRRLISQETYDKKKAQLDSSAHKKESDLKRQAFEKDKQAQEIQIIIATALGVAKAIPNPYLMAFAAAAGLLQLAIVQSQPTPKFAKGVVGINGKGTGTSDEIHAMLSNGESVVTANATNTHRGLLEAMNKGVSEKYIQDFYIAPILRAQLKKQSDLKDSSFASNIANSLALNSNFKDGNLLDSMKQSRKQERENALFIAKALSKSHNSRRP